MNRKFFENNDGSDVCECRENERKDLEQDESRMKYVKVSIKGFSKLGMFSQFLVDYSFFQSELLFSRHEISLNKSVHKWMWPPCRRLKFFVDPIYYTLIGILFDKTV